MASLILKNSVQNYVSEFVQSIEAVQALVDILLQWLVQEEGYKTADASKKKLLKEAIAVLSKIGFQQFIEYHVNETERQS